MKHTAISHRGLALALLFFSASNVLAAVKCEMTDTAISCWQRVMDATDTPEVRTAIQKQQEELRQKDLLRKPTGVQTGGLNLKSNTTDFLPLLAMSGLLDRGKPGDTQGTYVVDLNYLIPGIGKDSKLQAVINSQPKVSDAIKSQLPESKRDELVKNLEDGLGDLSDYNVSYTFSWTDRSHGRGFQQYRNRFDALVSALVQPSPSSLDPNQRLQELAKDPDRGEFGDAFDVKFQDMFTGITDAKVRDARKAALKERIEAAASDAADLLIQDRKAIADAGLESFASLIDNQPQLNFSAQRHFRDKVVGGDETSGKISYEWGRANLNNALSDKCQQDLDTPATDTIDSTTLERCLSEYTAFVKANEQNLKDGDKFSFSAEYLNANKEVFDLPSQGLTGLKIDAAKKLIISAGWSRLFADPAGGDQPVRVDFVGSYENVSNDPQRQDRGVATLTITRKFGNLTVPLGIVYANHGEFLGDVNKQLSAHLGLKFDLGATQTLTGK
jgi:hypothetical protein